MSPRPWYVALEGVEGCGKSSQAARLAERLGAVLTRETGGTAIGGRIRAILHDTALTHLSHRAEALLAAADRAQHLDEVVLPALDAGRHVVSDRTVWSSLAYQGAGRGLPLEVLREINDFAVQGRWPDVVVLLDVPDHVAAQRLHGRDLDRFEREDAEFHARVREGFASLAAAGPERWVVVDGDGAFDDVAGRIADALAQRGVPL